MPTSSKQASNSKAKSQSTTKKSPPSRVNQARAVAVDVPVGAVLEVSDRVGGLVEPFTGRTAARKQLRTYRTQLRRTVKRTERRGASARRKASTEVRKTRAEVEQRVRKTLEEQAARAQDLVDQVGEQLTSLR